MTQTQTLLLLKGLENFLTQQVPLAGGWHPTIVENPTEYPYGSLFSDAAITEIGCYERREHRGIITVYTGELSPVKAEELIGDVHSALKDLSLANVNLARFIVTETMTREEKLKWKGQLSFNAITMERI